MKLMRLAVIGAIALTGCGEAAEEPVGQVELTLLGQASSGTSYRLRDAIVMVQGPDSTLFFNTEDEPNRASLNATVTPGTYFSWLQEGWRLERLNPDFTGTTVEAELLSPNPTGFDVFPDTSTRVALRFRAGADDVNMDRGSFDIVIEVEEEPRETTLCGSDSECGAGETCCLAGFLGTCTRLDPGEVCPLPDLTVSADTALSSLMINREFFPSSSCALAEGCVNAPGDRRLLRFSTQTPNVGEADVILGDPTLVPGFEFSACHGHYHFEDYASYELYDVTGTLVATGHKQAFCLLDSTPVGIPGAPTSPRFHCGFQGIQRGWSDIYGSGLDCQWVDITDVPGGDYLLRISINAGRTLPESDYSNNTIELPVFIPTDVPPDPADPLSACAFSTTGPSRDCGWSIAAGYESASCTPGAAVVVGCGCGAGGTCGGDPMIRVCEGSSACTAGAALALVDDACSYCPETSFVCPPSGVYTVLTGAYNSTSAYTCGVASSL